jgi:hypothetical protein
MTTSDILLLHHDGARTILILIYCTLISTLMSETASFVDPVFLARFGLFRGNVIDYFLHPLNPFRTQANTSNEVLSMQGMAIGMFMQHGTSSNGGEPLSPKAAEDEYNAALSRLSGEQYELLPPADDGSTTTASAYLQPSNLFTIRHILRSHHPPSIKVLGIYYVVQGVIYISPPVRSIQKTHVARVLQGLRKAQQALSPCARYHPSVGHVWIFEQAQQQSTVASSSTRNKRKMDDDEDDDDDDDYMDPMALVRLVQSRTKRLKFVDRRKPGQPRTAAEEEGIRASEAMDQILVRISKGAAVRPTSAKSDARALRNNTGS